MFNTINVTQNILYVGASDRKLDRFENMLPLPEGVSYNSYVILDEKTALLDTVDVGVGKQYIENVKAALNGRQLDYLVLHHMEPDHCASIEEIAQLYPNAKIVGNAKTFQFLEQFYHTDLSDRYFPVKEGDTLELGEHSLKFMLAPMVHWPEVMFSYEAKEGILFSADAFGTFGSVDGNIFDDQMDYIDVYLDESRRYYTNIVGKYGAPVQMALKKAAELDIKMIAPLHGPIIRKNIEFMIDKYQKWSTYTPEVNSALIVYGSMYGNTESVAESLSGMLSQRGIENIKAYDVSTIHPSFLVAEAFRYSHIIFASPTYNLNIYYPMHTYIHELGALNVQKRKYSLIGNGSWAPTAGKLMGEMLSSMPNMEQIGECLEIRSSLKDEDAGKLEKLADQIAESIKNS